MTHPAPIGYATACAFITFACTRLWGTPPAMDADREGQATNLLPNAGFEQGWSGWSPLWERHRGAGRAQLSSDHPHAGQNAMQVDYTSTDDWSLSSEPRIPVTPGELFEMGAWLRIRGEGRTVVSVITRNRKEEVVEWNYAAKALQHQDSWTQVATRFMIPPGVASIQARIVGEGPASIGIDEVTLVPKGRLAAPRHEPSASPASLTNSTLILTWLQDTATFRVLDRRTGHLWQQAAGATSLISTACQRDGHSLRLALIDPATLRAFAATISMNGDRPELTLTLDGDGDLELPLSWPAPFLGGPGEFLILPVNEGLSVPADDKTLPESTFCLYGGHGLCMPWYGVTSGDAGWMAYILTPDDAEVEVRRREGRLLLAPCWIPQKGKFGPRRTLRYTFFNEGGYVAMAKCYRAEMAREGSLTTLAEKRRKRPAIDLLVGAVNIWCWDPDAPSLCRELRSNGVQRILWSNELTPDAIRTLNRMDVLTSRYDIYQDTMNPANFDQLPGLHPDWTTAAWTNDDLMIREDGQWVRGWEVKGRNGSMIPCGVLCDRQALAYARERIPRDLATHPYLCRFIDTTTASPWRECWNPRHPMTRTESKRYKMELLDYVGRGCGLVCGSETGHDAAVPYVDYFEGMMSLGPFRVPDAGRDIERIWDKAPARVATFQTGHYYRLPLWELVYHDCVVSYWYWGDYNNKIPSLWERRDLWNALYGTPPMFMFDRRLWREQRARFARSYQTAEPVSRATGYTEMLSHQWLTPDHAVQRTRFANGLTVTVNFGSEAWRDPAGQAIPPLGHTLSGPCP